MLELKNIAILCSGGDVSGMNAALKRFVEYSKTKGITPYFIHHGYEGLIDNKIMEADYGDVSGIISRGGTSIGTSRSQRFMKAEFRAKALENLRALQIGYVVVLGGDGSFRGMKKISDECEDINFCGIPSTIDNDIAGTEYCLGVDTALNVIKFSIDSIRDTASSFGRAFVIETMGRNSGYLALVTALTSRAEMCLIPEIPYDLERYKKSFFRQIKEGRQYFISVLSEALHNTKEIAEWYRKELGIEARTMVLGHIQRGGNPTVHDRLMAFHFVTHAIDSLLGDAKSTVICYNDGGFDSKKIEDVSFKISEINADLLKLGMEYGRH